jgi:hypothetical protein
MSRFSLCVLALVLFFAGIFVDRLCLETLVCASSCEAGGVAIQNGDANGDGERDISDAIHLLLWLFGEGAEPVPCAADCPPRFVDHGDGTVTDQRTGLLWQKTPCDANGDGTISLVDIVEREGASAAAGNLVLGGHGGWRVPNTAELSTLIELQDFSEPGMDPVFDCPQGSYWVLSTNGGDPCHGASLCIYFGMGGGFAGLSSWGYLRAVWGPPVEEVR